MRVALPVADTIVGFAPALRQRAGGLRRGQGQEHACETLLAPFAVESVTAQALEEGEGGVLSTGAPIAARLASAAGVLP